MLEIPLINREVEIKIGNEVYKLPVKTLNAPVSLLLSEIESSVNTHRNSLTLITEKRKISHENLKELESKLEIENLKTNKDKDSYSELRTKFINESENLVNLDKEMNEISRFINLSFVKMLEVCIDNIDKYKHIIDKIPFQYYQEFFELVLVEMQKTENTSKKKLTKK